MKNTNLDDAKVFASVLRETIIENNMIKFGNFKLNCTKGVSSRITYNEAGIDLLNNCHQYTFKIYQGELQISLQLYDNGLQLRENGYYRLFADVQKGMLFSLNLTTEKESDNIIYLTQKIKFSEGGRGSVDKKTSQIKRKQKQILLCEIYRNMGLEVTENNDLILGIFDPVEMKFINTSAETFLNDFIAVSILKGHFQGNKGYSLDILPSYQNEKLITDDVIVDNEKKLPNKIAEQKGKRTIPLAFRYQIFKRDNSKCVACGRGVNDGAILHIDHKIPFSLGGLTVLDNLQTLCSECNISKSNRFID